jgi:cobalt/nickel transport system permease protein
MTSMSEPMAMHMSDGLINAPVSALFGMVAVLGVSLAATRARRDLDERTAPMAGLVAAFIFAVQMLNFPVLPGVSGHLLGGALAAILVGPWVGRAVHHDRARGAVAGVRRRRPQPRSEPTSPTWR